jgi:hypothetical protein
VFFFRVDKFVSFFRSNMFSIAPVEVAKLDDSEKNRRHCRQRWFNFEWTFTRVFYICDAKLANLTA